MPRVLGPSPADHRPGLVKHFPEGGRGAGLAIEEQRIEGNAHHKVPRKRLADQEPTWLSLTQRRLMGLQVWASRGRSGQLGLEPAEVLTGNLECDGVIAGFLLGKVDRQAIGVLRPGERARMAKQLDGIDLAGPLRGTYPGIGSPASSRPASPSQTHRGCSHPCS